MSLNKPANKEELKEFCLRQLGYPVVQINVDDEQVNDAVELDQHIQTGLQELQLVLVDIMPAAEADVLTVVLALFLLAALVAAEADGVPHIQEE